MASCSVIVLILALASGSAFYLLEQRAISTWPPPGWSWEQNDVFQTAAGPVKLPMFIHKASVVGAFYLVEPGKAQELLPDDLEPLVLPFINKAITGIIMFDYKNTTLGPYGEMGLVIQARRKGSGATFIGYLYDLIAHVYKLPAMLSLFSSDDTGLYVVHLPLTTELAKAAGVEIWGYPKYVTTIESDFSKPDKMKFTLTGEFTFKMSQSSFSPSISALPFLTYTKLNGKLVRTFVETASKAEYGFKDAELNIFGKGTTADAMKKLGLDMMSPFTCFRSDTLRALLDRPKVLG